jgi:proton-coupled amino acid transporter
MDTDDNSVSARGRSGSATTFYSKLVRMRSNIGLDVKRNHYRHLSEEIESIDTYPEASDADKANVCQTYFTFFKSFIGIGVLALPHGFKTAGSVFGVLMILMASTASWYCIGLLMETADIVEQQILEGTVNPNLLPDGVDQASAPPSATSLPITPITPSEDIGNKQETTTSKLKVGNDITYSDIGRAAYGSIGAKIVDFSIVVAQMGFSTAYLIFIGSNVEAALSTCVGPSSWATITAVLVCPLVWLKSLKKLSFGAILADFAIVFGLVTILTYAALNSGDTQRPPQDPAQAIGSSPMIFFGTAVFAFEGAGIVLPMKQSMQEPREFSNILKNGLICVTTLYVFFPLCIYLSYGSVTKDMITENLPSGQLIVIFVELSYSLGLFFTYPIMMFPAVEILESSRMYSTFKKFMRGKTYNDDTVPSVLFRSCLVLITLIAATSIPKFGTFVAIVGSVACSRMQTPSAGSTSSAPPSSWRILSS